MLIVVMVKRQWVRKDYFIFSRRGKQSDLYHGREKTNPNAVIR